MSEHPQRYDITIDAMRPMTQKDVDELTRAVTALGMYRKATEEICRMSRAVVTGEMSVAEFSRKLEPFLHGPA